MAKTADTLIDRLLHRRSLRRWARAAEEARSLDLTTLRSLRTRARQMRREIDKLTHIADERLMLPLIGPNAIRAPLNADWTWRPTLWRGPLTPPGLAGVASATAYGDELTVFHDCGANELTLRQIRNTREDDLAPFALRVDVFRFEGSFLSFAIDLPRDAVRGLRLRHLVQLDVRVELEKPLEIFARLNIRHGPNTEQIVRELPRGAVDATAEFDLAYSRINEKRVERMWLDLIFEEPGMNQIVLRDLTFCRRPRAEL